MKIQQINCREKGINLTMSNNSNNAEDLPILVNRVLNENERMPRLTNATCMRDYFARSEDNREFNIGCMDSIKSQGNVRMLSLNPIACACNFIVFLNLLICFASLVCKAGRKKSFN